MNRGTIVLMVIGGIALVALIAAALSGTTTETSLAPPELRDVESACMRADAPATCVIGKSATDPGGLSIFGITLFAQEVTYRVTVQVQAGQGCVERVRGVERVDRWPAAFPECTSDFTRPGEIVGHGAPEGSGRQALIVQVEVPEDCYGITAPGRAWPADDPACA